MVAAEAGGAHTQDRVLVHGIVHGLQSRFFPAGPESSIVRCLPSPMFFVSVASKGFRVCVSGLESTLAGWFVSVAFKWVRETVV